MVINMGPFGTEYSAVNRTGGEGNVVTAQADEAGADGLSKAKGHTWMPNASFDSEEVKLGALKPSCGKEAHDMEGRKLKAQQIIAKEKKSTFNPWKVSLGIVNIPNKDTRILWS